MIFKIGDCNKIVINHH